MLSHEFGPRSQKRDRGHPADRFGDFGGGMGLLGLVAGLRALVGKRRVDGELDEELDGFVEASAAEKVRQ